MKKLVVVFNVLTVALLAGAYALHFFSLRKLGMVRWLNFHSQNIRDAIPLDVVKYLVLAVSIILIIIFAWRIIKSPRRTGGAIANVVFAVLVAATNAFVVLAVSHNLTKADVFIVVIVGIAALLQSLTMALVCFSLDR